MNRSYKNVIGLDQLRHLTLFFRLSVSMFILLTKCLEKMVILITAVIYIIQMARFHFDEIRITHLEIDFFRVPSLRHNRYSFNLMIIIVDRENNKRTTIVNALACGDTCFSCCISDAHVTSIDSRSMYIYKTPIRVIVLDRNWAIKSEVYLQLTFSC